MRTHSQVEDAIMDIASFEQFLTERIKVGGKVEALGDARLGVLGQELRHGVLRVCHEQEIFEVPHEEVLEEAQRETGQSDSSNKDKENVYELRYFKYRRRRRRRRRVSSYQITIIGSNILVYFERLG